MIQQEQASSDLSVAAWCEALAVSASGYYAWCQRDSSAHQQADARLGAEIERVFADSRRTYGSRRVWLVLRERGIRTHKRRAGLTKAGQSAYFGRNLLKQVFRTMRHNEKWVTDTTYIPTREGWLYLVRVMDLFSRQIIGWAMGTHHDAALATSALNMAVQRARPDPRLILHCDRGSEFANAMFHARADQANIRLSMSSTGNCYDNASAESFFATVKLEAILEGIFASRRAALVALFDYIEVFYNRQRLHSGIDYARPVGHAA